MPCFFAISVLESAPRLTSCSIFTLVLRSFGGWYAPRLAITRAIEITSVALPPKTRRRAATQLAQHRHRAREHRTAHRSIQGHRVIGCHGYLELEALPRELARS
uniref:Uncharacterized protein n=1 Tax=Ixodes ricinus TaxID=34613 RepID=A0A6B0UG38_IXORI